MERKNLRRVIKKIHALGRDDTSGHINHNFGSPYVVLEQEDLSKEEMNDLLQEITKAIQLDNMNYRMKWKIKNKKR